MRDVQHQDGGARRPVVGLVHHEVLVVQVEQRGPRCRAVRGDGRSRAPPLRRKLEPLPRDRVLERLGEVQVEGVAELVGLAPRVGLDAGGVLAGLVGTDARLAHRRQQVPKRAVPQEVEPLSCHVEVDLARRVARFVHLALSRGLPDRPPQPPHLPVQRDVPLLDHLANDVVEEVGDLLLNVGVPGPFAPQLLDHFGGQLAALGECAQQRLFQRIERRRILHPGPAPVGVEVRPPGEAAVEEELREHFEQLLEIEGVEPALPVLRVGGEAHDEQWTVEGVGAMKGGLRHPRGARFGAAEPGGGRRP